MEPLRQEEMPRQIDDVASSLPNLSSGIESSHLRQSHSEVVPLGKGLTVTYTQQTVEYDEVQDLISKCTKELKTRRWYT